MVLVLADEGLTAAEFEQAMDEGDPDEALARAILFRQKGGKRTTYPMFD